MVVGGPPSCVTVSRCGPARLAVLAHRDDAAQRAISKGAGEIVIDCSSLVTVRAAETDFIRLHTSIQIAFQCRAGMRAQQLRSTLLEHQHVIGAAK